MTAPTGELGLGELLQPVGGLDLLAMLERRGAQLFLRGCARITAVRGRLVIRQERHRHIPENTPGPPVTRALVR
jgi:hypothetical protein